MRFVHQRHNVRLFEPHLAMCVHRQVVRKRARQQHTVDAAGRSAGDRVNEYPQLDGFADRLNELEIKFFGIGFARVAMVDVAV